MSERAAAASTAEAVDGRSSQRAFAELSRRSELPCFHDQSCAANELVTCAALGSYLCRPENASAYFANPCHGTRGLWSGGNSLHPNVDKAKLAAQGGRFVTKDLNVSVAF